MAKYIIQIPANYAGRVGGNRQVSIEASSPSEAKTKVVEAGIPAVVLGTPVEIKGEITSGSLPPDVSQYALPDSGSERSAVLRGDRIVGTNNPTFPRNNYDLGVAGGEILSGNQFPPNINPPPTEAEIQAAIPFTPGTPGDPFYQPPSYQPMTTADFAQIKADQDAAERARIEQELLNLDAAEIANIEADVRRQLADRRAQELINASAALNFNNEEGSIAGGLFRDPNAFPATTTGGGYSYLDEPVFDEGDGEQTSIQNLFRFNPGSVAGEALSTVYDPTKGPVDGTNYLVQPPAGYVPPTGTVPATGAMPSPVGIPAFSSQELINDPQGFLTGAGQRLAFRNVFGEEAASGIGPLASFLQRQTFPLTQAYRASNFVNMGREQAGEPYVETSFEDFLRSIRDQPTGLTGAYNQALQDVNYLRGFERSQLPSELAEVFSPNQAAGTRDARALLEAAQRGKYSRLVSSAFRQPSEDDLFADYVLAKQDAATAGTAPQNFLNFAASRYGL